MLPAAGAPLYVTPFPLLRLHTFPSPLPGIVVESGSRSSFWSFLFWVPRTAFSPDLVSYPDPLHSNGVSILPFPTSRSCGKFVNTSDKIATLLQEWPVSVPLPLLS